MKSIFIALLIANIAYAVYGFLAKPAAFDIFSPAAVDDVRSPDVDAQVKALDAINEMSKPVAENDSRVEASVSSDELPDVVEGGDAIAYVRLCSGPLNNVQVEEDALKTTEQWLAELVKSDEIKRAAVETVAGDVRHWVYLPAEKDFDAAKRALANLQSKKIDSFIMGAGEYQHAISLGYFVTDAQAKTLQARVKKQGVNAKIIEITQNDKQWLVMDVVPAMQDEIRNDMITKGFSLADKEACEAL